MTLQEYARAVAEAMLEYLGAGDGAGETIIRWDDEEQVAWLYTCSPVTVRKWLKNGYSLSKDGHGWRCRIPAKLVRFGKPASEAQKASGRRLRGVVVPQGAEVRS